jgi:hypothetical protein
MPIYRYRCRICGDVYEPFLSPDADAKTLLDTGTCTCHTASCPGTYRRVFSLAIQPQDSFGPEFYHPPTGQMISSHRQLDDVNKIMSDQTSERLGFENTFRTRDLADLKLPDSEHPTP